MREYLMYSSCENDLVTLAKIWIGVHFQGQLLSLFHLTPVVFKYLKEESDHKALFY